MRTLMKVQMDTEAANQAIKNGSMQSVMQSTMDMLKPEAAYFTAEGGMRTAFIIFDLHDPAQMPTIAEPLFQPLKAKISMTPVMNADDLQAGLEQLAKNMKSM
jgi:hypothetical protein